MINKLNAKSAPVPEASGGLIDPHFPGKTPGVDWASHFVCIENCVAFFERPGERQQHTACEFLDFRKCVRFVLHLEDDGGRPKLQQ